MSKYLKLLLLPFGILYGSIMAIRNYLYKRGAFSSKRFNLPVLSVGNLTVGGTGKTPHVEYLLRLFNTKRIATLSRGYKRKSKGFILAREGSTVMELGDEPFQYHKDFEDVSVAVCEKRVEGIERLNATYPDLDAIVLDDAFQHLAVKPSFNIMLTDYNRPFYKDFVLPAGLLREFKGGAKRADVIIVSKCPERLSSSEMLTIERKVRQYASVQSDVFFTTYTYGQPVSIGKGGEVGKNVVLLTGIANPDPLRQYLSPRYSILKEFTYPDHHTFTLTDLLKVKEYISKCKFQDVSILTTRKDAVKIQDSQFDSILNELPVFYLPIEVKFLQEGENFDKLLLSHVNEF